MKKIFTSIFYYYFFSSAFFLCALEEPFYFTSFSLSVREKAVVITWNASHEGKNVILYRSTKPFDSIRSLAGAVPVSYFKDEGVPFIDYPVPDTPFYYAVIEEGQLDGAAVLFINGKNTSNTPAVIQGAGEKTERFEGRNAPLPFLNPKKTEKKQTRFFSSETEKALQKLFFNNDDFDDKEDLKEKEPYIFPQDRESPDGGESMALQRIINGVFTAKDWFAAEKDLRDFLKIKRTSKVASRTRFYVGETLFFLKKYDEALLTFLTVQDSHEALSAEWIRLCLLGLADSSKER